MLLIVGDVNALHSRWDTSTSEDGRGEQLADEIDAAYYTIFDENEATLDISLASNDIALLSDWSVSTSLASDHLPMLMINSELSTMDWPRRTYINFKKADWARYAEACDKYLAEAGETRTVVQAERTFRKAENTASDIFIPVCRIQHFQPPLPASAKSLADERDRKCGLNPADEALIDLRISKQRYNHPDPKARQGQQHRQELAPNLSTVPNGQSAGKTPARNTESSLSTLLNMAFGRNTRHALLCRRSPPTLQPASQEKSRLAE